jgi:hypothetical protein
MGLRPELVIPQIEKFRIRSYRDLPSRRIMTGFRYTAPVSPISVSLVTDLEYPALDAIGTFANESDYLSEIAELTQFLTDFLAQKLKLSVFTVQSGESLIYCSLLPNGQALEVCRIRKFGQTLARAVDYGVLQPTNVFEPPFIFSVNITSKLFVAVVAAHSSSEKVVLPTHSLRAFGTSFGVDLSALNGLRIDATKLAFTPERFANFNRQGQLFALVPEAENVKIVTAVGEEVVSPADVRGRIEAILEAHDRALAEREAAEFQGRIGGSVRFVAEGQALPPEFVVAGTKPEEPGVKVAVRPFVPFE